MVVSTNNNRAPILTIHPDAWALIQEFVRQCANEINGFAYVSQLTPSEFYVGADDVFITEQEVSPGSADVDGDTFARACIDAAMAGRATELKLQWHSHVNMQAYFSATDMRTIDAYGEGGCNWMISLVTNKRGEYEVRLDWYYPHRMSVPLTMQLETSVDEQMAERVANDIDRFVTVKPPVRRRGYGTYFGGTHLTVPDWSDLPDVDEDEDWFDVFSADDEEWAELTGRRNAIIEQHSPSRPAVAQQQQHLPHISNAADNS